MITRTAAPRRRTRSLARLAIGWALIAAGTTAAVSAPIKSIERRGILEVCLNPDAMPFSTAVEGPRGLHVDLANAIAREIGVSASFSWIQFRFQAKYTRCDAYMGVGVLPGEDDSPVKKTKPFLKFETVLVSRPGVKLDTLEALDGKKIALQSGSLAHVKLLDRPVDVRVAFTREDELLAAVADGRLDGGFVSNFGLQWFLKRHPEAHFETWSVAPFQDRAGYPIAIGLRKADKETVERFETIIGKLRESGELARIFAAYGMADLLMEPTPADR